MKLISNGDLAHFQYIEISLVHNVIQQTRVRANRQIAKVSIVRLEEEIDREGTTTGNSMGASSHESDLFRPFKYYM